MSHRVSLKEAVAVNRSITLRCGKACVAEELLDHAQVGAAAQKMRCEGMPQRVRGCCHR